MSDNTSIEKVISEAEDELSSRVLIEREDAQRLLDQFDNERPSDELTETIKRVRVALGLKA